MHDHPRREKATVGSVVRHPTNRLRFSWNVAINSCDFVVTFALVGFQVFLRFNFKISVLATRFVYAILILIKRIFELKNEINVKIRETFVFTSIQISAQANLKIYPLSN